MSDQQKQITPKNIKSFFQGYSRYYYDNIFGLAPHIKQQVTYRIWTCRDTCLMGQGKCEVCGCPTIQKAYATKACNPAKFPDLMDKTSWDEFMKTHGITDEIEYMQEEVDRLIKANNIN